MTILLRNIAALVTCDDQDTVLHGVDMLIEDRRITAIGSHLVVPGPCTPVDASNWYVYPGLINTHHHFFQALVRNRPTLAWPMEVLDWIARIYPTFERLPAEAFYYSALISMADLIKHGCTTAFDHQYCFPAGITRELVDLQFEAAQQFGMRLHAGRGANTLDQRRGGVVPDALVETPEAFLQDCERLISKFHDPGPLAMRRVVVSPCQPANCCAQTFTDSVSLSRARGVRMHTHLGEGENEVIKARHGVGSIAWCEAQGFAGPDVWMAHGWEFDRQEIAALAASQTGVAYCPAPVFLVGQRITDVIGMAESGVRIGLGVDGQASNDSSNLLECIRTGYLLQTLAAGLHDRASPRPADFLRYATRGGADLLGCSELGQLIPGAGADFFCVDVEGLEYAGALHDPMSLPAKVGISGHASMTVINGRIVWRDGEFPDFDEARLAAEARALIKQLDIKL